jgi:hypothetical protein
MTDIQSQSDFEYESLMGYGRPHYGPGVDSAFNRNECQEYFLVGKCDLWLGLTTLPPSNTEPRNLNLLEPSGPVQACAAK